MNKPRGAAQRALTASLFAVLCLASVEAASSVYYAFFLDSPRKALVELAMRPEKMLPRLQCVPNTFWHHDLPRELLNSKRTIGPEFEVPKPAGVYRVLCLGDSTSAFSHHHPEVLQKTAGLSYEGKPVEVVNAGVPSHCSAFTLSYFALRLIHFQPDMVVLKIGYNDYVPFTHPEVDYDYSPGFPPFAVQPRDERFWRLARHSYALRMLGVCALDLPGEEFAKPWVRGDHDLLKHRGKYRLFTENFRSIVQLCQARGIRVFLLDLPFNKGFEHKAYPPRYNEFVDAMNEELREAARSTGAELIETSGLLTAGDFGDKVHLHPSGGQKIARQIAERAGFAGMAKP